MVATQLTESTPRRREREVYEFIVNFELEHGTGPGLRDIVNAGLIGSTSSAWDIVKRLERQGKVEAPTLKSRARRTLRRGDVCPRCGCGGEHG